MDFKPSWAEHGLINKVFAIGHAYDYDVVECFYSIDIGEQLVDH